MTVRWYRDVLSDWLDKEDFIDDSYILEGKLPGLGRPLKKEKDFKRSLGEAVDISCTAPSRDRKISPGFSRHMTRTP